LEINQEARVGDWWIWHQFKGIDLAFWCVEASEEAGIDVPGKFRLQNQ
jgi:hypothetical protein